MSDTGVEAPSRLITEYHDSVRRRAFAGRVISLLTALIIVVYIVLIGARVNIFLKSDLQTFGVEFAEQTFSITSQHPEQFNQSMSRIQAAHMDAFKKVIENDWEKMESSALVQSETYQAHITQNWPAIESAIQSLSSAQETLLVSELSPIIGEEKARQVAATVKERINTSHAEAIKVTIDEPLLLADEIGVKLGDLVNAESSDLTPAEAAKSFGIIMQLTEARTP